MSLNVAMSYNFCLIIWGSHVGAFSLWDTGARVPVWNSHSIGAFSSCIKFKIQILCCKMNKTTINLTMESHKIYNRLQCPVWFWMWEEMEGWLDRNVLPTHVSAHTTTLRLTHLLNFYYYLLYFNKPDSLFYIVVCLLCVILFIC